MKHALPMLAALCALVAAPGDEQERALERGRACCQRFYAGELEALWEEFDAPLRGVLESLAGLERFRAQSLAQLGAEVAVVEESATVQGPLVAYSRKARFEKVPALIEVAFSFGPQDRISGFVIRPVPGEAPSAFLAYRTKTELRLPFEGEWYVFWGGRTLAQNYHAAAADQRFAYDLVILRDGSSHTGAGLRNEDYHCFGRPILAPGAGVVVSVLDGIADNVPGVIERPAHAGGNHVVLDHGNGEHSMLAHFQRGSVKVKPGERVPAGALLGLCGNSGNSSEPHLHYHLQNTPVFHAGQGLPAQFQHYQADGEPVERGEPVQGQRIRHHPSEGTPAPADDGRDG